MKDLSASFVFVMHCVNFRAERKNDQTALLSFDYIT